MLKVITAQMSETEALVKKLSDDNKMVFTLQYLGEGKRDSEEKYVSDHFKVKIRNNNSCEQYSFDFWQGIGHREMKNTVEYGVKKRVASAVKAPTIASIMYCLLADMDFGSMSFYDFCQELDYNYDSRKDLALHAKIEGQTANMRRVLRKSGTYVEDLKAALEDY